MKLIADLLHKVEPHFEKGGKLAIQLFQVYEFCRKELIKAYEYLSIEDQILLKKGVSEFVSNKSELKTVYLGVISWIFSNLIAPLTTPSIKLDSASIIGNFNWLLL